MNKDIIKLLLLVILTVFLPSLLISLGIYIFTNHFWPTLLVSSGIIYVIGMISNKISEYKINTKIHSLNQEISKRLLDQTLEVSCAYCGYKHIIPIKVDERNTFECKNCKQISLIVFQFTTAQLTTPILDTEKNIQQVINDTVKS